MSNEFIKDNLRVFVVPVDVLELEELSIYEKMVYIVLRSFCNPHKAEAFPSYETIAKMGSMSRRHAIRCVNSLIEKGLIKKEMRFDVTKNKQIRKTSNLYKLHTPKKRAKEVVTHSHQGGDSQSPGVVTHSHQGSDSQSPEHNQGNKINKNINGWMVGNSSQNKKTGQEDKSLALHPQNEDTDKNRAAETFSPHTENPEHTNNELTNNELIMVGKLGEASTPNDGNKSGAQRALGNDPSMDKLKKEWEHFKRFCQDQGINGSRALDMYKVWRTHYNEAPLSIVVATIRELIHDKIKINKDGWTEVEYKNMVGLFHHRMKVWREMAVAYEDIEENGGWS